MNYELVTIVGILSITILLIVKINFSFELKKQVSQEKYKEILEDLCKIKEENQYNLGKLNITSKVLDAFFKSESSTTQWAETTLREKDPK